VLQQDLRRRVRGAYSSWTTMTRCVQACPGRSWATDWTVTEAVNGRAGLEALARRARTFIVLDLMMPEVMRVCEFLARAAQPARMAGCRGRSRGHGEDLTRSGPRRSTAVLPHI
jgi:CheY-like chemotaxis protein